MQSKPCLYAIPTQTISTLSKVSMLFVASISLLNSISSKVPDFISYPKLDFFFWDLLELAFLYNVDWRQERETDQNIAGRDGTHVVKMPILEDKMWVKRIYFRTSIMGSTKIEIPFLLKNSGSVLTRRLHHDRLYSPFSDTKIHIFVPFLKIENLTSFLQFVLSLSLKTGIFQAGRMSLRCLCVSRTKIYCIGQFTSAE